MADELRLDIIVDDHGAVQKLEDVDKGVNKVTTTAQSGTPSLEALNRQFGDARARLDVLSTRLAANSTQMSAMATIAGGVALSAVAAYGAALRAAAADAVQFADAGRLLGELPDRIQAVSIAATELDGSGDRMVGVMLRLQEAIGSGKLDSDIKRLVGDLQGFKDQGIVDQLTNISHAVEAIPDPLDRAAARARVFGQDAEEIGRLAKAGFADAARGADTMSKETIKALSDAEREFDRIVESFKSKSKTLAAETFMWFLDPLGKNDIARGVREMLPPTPPRPAPDLPAGPTAMPDTEFLEAHMRRLELQKQEEENWYRIDDIMRQIGQTQDYIVKRGGDWSDVLNTRVATVVDSINQKFVTAVMLNEQLKGGAIDGRDALMQKLTATTNPNESEFDRRFNEIDQQAKAKLAAVDQTDRVSAAAAENAILEEMNLKVLELQQSWEGVNQQKDAGINKISTIKSAIDTLLGGGSAGPAFGSKLPGGLVMPTADQVATGRYFGPVDANGRPDPARMNGATPAVTNININANNSVNTDGWEALLERLEQGLLQREMNSGTRVRR